MRKRQSWFAAILIVVFLFDNPQIVQAKTYDERFSFSDNHLFYDDDLKSNTEKKDVYDITYHLNGGMANILEYLTYTEEELPLQLPIPERAGYNFAGWYLESGYRHKISIIENCENGDITLYAKWTRNIDAAYNVQMYSYNTSAIKSAADKKLKNCTYGFVNNIEIPGMPSTREKDYMENLIITYGQCPQGICLTEDYYLISAYSTDNRESLGSMYVFDRRTGEFLVTLGMKKKSHLGGLAYDGTDVWICHSDSKALERISYEYIKKVAKNKPRTFVDSTGLFREYRVSNMPSCVAAYDGKLWVATHNTVFKSIMIAYEYRDDKLQMAEYYRIPEKVQGLAFDGEGHIYLSTSYGRKKSSYLKVYKSVEALNKSPGKPMVKVEMPPCSEEICMSDDKVYVLFESASLKYFEGTDGRGKSIAPIDKILTINIGSILR